MGPEGIGDGGEGGAGGEPRRGWMERCWWWWWCCWWWWGGRRRRKESKRRGLVRLATCFAFGKWWVGLGVGAPRGCRAVADVIHHFLH
ncbi:hypothetical protein SORBI_3003G043650 [Sorghum bicolor]|uniref:Uncharacterized protein n=1 Tax=Sorghum bicolor TaxID=4558 RepID=A0A1W0VVP1_SORBI|nr:hypothetical protein SORBI_3003G043650 [Sorghum bicolor]